MVAKQDAINIFSKQSASKKEIVCGATRLLPPAFNPFFGAGVFFGLMGVKVSGGEAEWTVVSLQHYLKPEIGIAFFQREREVSMAYIEFNHADMTATYRNCLFFENLQEIEDRLKKSKSRRLSLFRVPAKAVLGDTISDIFGVCRELPDGGGYDAYMINHAGFEGADTCKFRVLHFETEDEALTCIRQHGGRKNRKGEDEILDYIPF